MTETRLKDAPRKTPGRPALDFETAAELLRTAFGIDGTASPLPSDRDQNFLVEATTGSRFVLKIWNADARRSDLEIQGWAMGVAAEAGLPVPAVISTEDGAALGSWTVDGTPHFFRLVSYLDGSPLAKANPQSVVLLDSFGSLLGVLDRKLMEREPPAEARPLIWDPVQAGNTILAHFDHLADDGEKSLVQNMLDLFTSTAAPVLDELPRQYIHADANDYNILVQMEATGHHRISALLDFGDMVFTARVSELAVACAYAMLDKTDPVGAACIVTAAYHASNPLTEQEIDVLFALTQARLGISVCMSAFQKQVEPGNEYLTISEAPVWRLIRALSDVHPRLARYRFREACGYEPFPGSRSLTNWLQKHQSEFSDVVTGGTAGGHVFDFSVGSTEWSSEELTHPSLGDFLDDTKIWNRLQSAGASFGIGRYDEPRLVYTTPQFRQAGGDQRTIHTGLDLFLPAGSPVFAPLDGTVQSAVDNAADGDYGPTIILRHDPPSGPVFWTLYGHLSRSSLDGLAPGTAVSAGDQIATFGSSAENGGWASHLHFQIIGDLLDLDGDFPGVAAPGQRAVWTSLCPDPHLIFGIPGPLQADDGKAIGERRNKVIGPSLSLSYRRPLHIVRGYMQHLYDSEGRAYLDGVNNVAHVGHAHPYVVRAGQAQMQTLNTNTRYLHNNLVEYAERLAATLPHGLDVVYFVNSGSEANDLALRIARNGTGSRQTIVIEGAYHGNLSSLIDISPYKYDGKGGSGRPSTTHAVPMPDTFRGVHREQHSGERYADYVREVCERLSLENERPTFISESALSCGGQIYLPDGYLAAAYNFVRAAGGVCIADEVQVGMGRMGSHFWGFEMQGVVPDIVTIGKPIGNGHPLGAVVTTRDLAESFDNGMEYFNTFGGNPVSCAIGLAVLDVLELENLQSRAEQTGAHLRAGLKRLMESHAVIGDVRGRGLFQGIELVRSRTTLEPAAEEASYVVNRMKDLGILLSTDGPLNNVIKIKPPLVFSSQDAERMTEALDRVFGEDAVTWRLS